MSNGQSHSWVTSAEIIDADTIKISVGISAFLPNESVEISGYVMQHQGAFAYFNVFRTINAKLGGTTTLEVEAIRAHDSAAFQKGHDLTVLLRAAKVWVTVLAEGQAQQSGIMSNAAEAGRVWDTVKAVVGPEKYPQDTWRGNQPAPPAAGAAPAAPGTWRGSHPAAAAGADEAAPDGDQTAPDRPSSHEAS